MGGYFETNACILVTPAYFPLIWPDAAIVSSSHHTWCFHTMRCNLTEKKPPGSPACCYATGSWRWRVSTPSHPADQGQETGDRRFGRSQRKRARISRGLLVCLSAPPSRSLALSAHWDFRLGQLDTAHCQSAWALKVAVSSCFPASAATEPSATNMIDPSGRKRRQQDKNANPSLLFLLLPPFAKPLALARGLATIPRRPPSPSRA